MVIRKRIHAQKFDRGLFYTLEHMGLATRENEDWFIVDDTTADYLMKLLATAISARLNMQASTDTFRKSNYQSSIHLKRETVLRNLIPFPEQIDLKKVLKFKTRHFKLLQAFKNKVEQIVFDGAIHEGTPLFNLKVKDLHLQKQELVAKMNESHITDIIFGTVCGIIGAAQGLAITQTLGAFVGGLPGFASAVHSALKIERADNIFD